MSAPQKIKELKRLRKYLVIFFVGFVVTPIFFGPLAFMGFESKENNEFSKYENAFIFNYEVIMGAELTDFVVTSTESKIVVGIFSLLNLIFVGFIAAIIITTLEIIVIREGIH